MYLITGGAGFIGSHIATRLVHQGHRVRVLDNLASGSVRNLEPIMDDVEFIEGDIRDTGALRRAMAGAEVVFHEAAEPSVPRSIADPASTFAINVEGTLNVLTAARDLECRRVVFATTCAIYGDAPELPKLESLPPAPLSPYAMSKLTGEHLCAMYSRLYGLETVGLRYFNVFGPRQDPSSAYAAAIPKFLEALHAGHQPRVFGDGEQSRDFVAVDDVVRANLLAAGADGVGGRVFNVASGKSVTINQVLATLGEVTGIDATPEYLPARAGDILHSLADVSLARRYLGFEATIGFREGIERIVHDGQRATTLIAA
ncbi:MAG: SDR family oxidoreductase [Chloroflexia bacterium]|nr:SDR family oxidoreductase [Chloroflexia bacterium]